MPSRASQVFGHRRLDASGRVVVPQMSEQQRRRQDGRGRVGDPLAGDVGRRPCTGSNIDGLVPLTSRLPLAASPMPPVTAAAEVGQDVTEQVVRDDDVEALAAR